MGSDVYMILFYFGTGLGWYAWGIITSIAINMVFQLVLVYMQNRKMGPERLGTELFTTTICLKPGKKRAKPGDEKARVSRFDLFILR